MQQNPQERRFAESQPQQPVYRFPQNQPQQAPGNHQSYSGYEDDAVHMGRRERKAANKAHRRKRRKIFTLWNLFAVVGIITVIIQAIRYVLIPLLVYLNTLTGGVL